MSPSNTKPVLGHAATSAALAAAVAGATETGAALTIAVVDDGGQLKGFVRMDGAPLISVRTAQRKAFAAAAIGLAPDDFYAAIQGDPGAVASFSSRDEIALIGGGIPVIEQASSSAASASPGQ